MIDLEAVGEISDTGTASICMCNDDHLVASVNELLPTQSVVSSEREQNALRLRAGRYDFRPLLPIISSYFWTSVYHDLMDKPDCGKKKSLTMLRMISARSKAGQVTEYPRDIVRHGVLDSQASLPLTLCRENTIFHYYILRLAMRIS